MPPPSGTARRPPGQWVKHERGGAPTAPPRASGSAYFTIGKFCFSHSVMPKAMSLTFDQPSKFRVIVT